MIANLIKHGILFAQGEGTVETGCRHAIFDQGIQLEEKEITALMPPTDWRDVAGCNLDELKAWAAALAMRAVRYRSKIPTGWDQVALCANCGPVYSFAAGDCLACPWCELKRAGKRFPQPEAADDGDCA